MKQVFSIRVYCDSGFKTFFFENGIDANEFLHDCWGENVSTLWELIDLHDSFETPSLEENKESFKKWISNACQTRSKEELRREAPPSPPPPVLGEPGVHEEGPLSWKE